MPTSNIQFEVYRTFSNFIIIPYYIQVNHGLSLYFILDVRIFFFSSLIFCYSSSNKLRFDLFIRRKNQSTTVYQFKTWFSWHSLLIFYLSKFGRIHFSIDLFFLSLSTSFTIFIFRKTPLWKKRKKKIIFIRLLCLSLSFYNILPYFFPLSFSFCFFLSLFSLFSYQHRINGSKNIDTLE